MAYRIVAKDFTVEVDTLVEFQNALNILRALEGKHKAPPIPESPERRLIPPEVPGERPTEATKMGNFYRNLTPSNTRNLIMALYDKPEGLTSLELQAALNTTPSGIGGVMGGVTKAAKPYELHRDDIVREVGGRYQLTPSIREIIRVELEKEPKRVAYE